MDERITQLAKAVAERGGRALLVGGCVRDELLGRENKDFDVEVFKLSVEELEEVLAEFGEVNSVGKSFAVYKLGQDIDVSLPRREYKVGEGHRGFEVVPDPFMSYEEACSRRDFTINALMKDPLGGKIIDPLGGQADLELRILRAVSEKTFQEDSLRVLRLAQFASRFDFDIENRTFTMAKETDLSDLPKERVWMEVEKLLMKSPDPSLGISHLVDLGIAEKCFPSVHLNIAYHTDFLREALRMSAEYTKGLSYGESLAVRTTLFCFCAQEGAFDELGLASVEGYPVRKKVEEMTAQLPYKEVDTDYEYHKLSQKVHMRLFARVLFCIPSTRRSAERFGYTISHLGCADEPVKPWVQGRDLIEMGMKPSKEMGEALAELYEMQIKGFSFAQVWVKARVMCGISGVRISKK